MRTYRAIIVSLAIAIAASACFDEPAAPLLDARAQRDAPRLDAVDSQGTPDAPSGWYMQVAGSGTTVATFSDPIYPNSVIIAATLTPMDQLVTVTQQGNSASFTGLSGDTGCLSTTSVMEFWGLGLGEVGSGQTITAAGSAFAIFAWNISGITLDGSVNDAGTNGSNTTSFASPPVATATANELVIVAANAEMPITLESPDYHDDENTASGNQGYGWAHLMNNEPSGTYPATWVTTSGSAASYWCTAAVTLSPAP
jgi:hypothetical protein